LFVLASHISSCDVYFAFSTWERKGEGRRDDSKREVGREGRQDDNKRELGREAEGRQDDSKREVGREAEGRQDDSKRERGDRMTASGR